MTVLPAAVLFIQYTARAQSVPPDRRMVSIDISDVSLFTVLSKLEQLSDYRFFYDRQAAKELRIRTLVFHSTSVAEILAYLTKNYPLTFQTERNEVSVHIEKRKRLIGQKQPGILALKEVTITSTFQKSAAEGFFRNQSSSLGMSEGIGDAQISRTPDNNAAQVLKRFSGLQLMNNKYVIIRGLSDRYNSVLLNGAPVPSSEPNRWDFAFDLIPGFLIDYIAVNKTATPDHTGDFAGGLVQVTTKDVPDTNFTFFDIGTGFNSQSTGKSFIGLGRSRQAYLSLPDSRYNKPAGMNFRQYNAMLPELESPHNTEARKEASTFLSSIPSNWLMHRYTAEPIRNYQLQLGRKIPFRNNSLGIIASFSYRNEQEVAQNDQYYPTVQDYRGTDYSFTSTVGGILNLGYQSATSKLSLKNTYNRVLNDLLYVFEGKDILNNAEVSNYSNTIEIRQLHQSILSGEHTVGKRGIRTSWQGSLAVLDRDQPNNKIMDRRKTASPNQPEEYYEYYFSDRQASLGSLYYSDLKERLYHWSADVLVPFRLNNKQQEFKAGYQGVYRKADFGADLYRIRSLPQDSGVTADFSGYAYYDVYHPANFASGELYLYPISGSGKDASGNTSGLGYSGFQQVNAIYGMFEFPLLNRLRITAGIRAESVKQSVSGYNPETETDKVSRSDETNWMPSVHFIYALSDKINIRAAWYKTVARPDLRELSSFEYFDPLLMRSISGNDLRSSSVTNYDLRYEFYPSPDEIFSASLFYKQLKDPIELRLQASSGKPEYRFTNLEAAQDFGLELHFRKRVNLLYSGFPLLDHLYLSGSFTWLKASVKLEPVKDTSGISYKRERPLYGQSPYILNGGIQHSGKRFGLSILYNRYGKRILFAARSMSEDEYEKPRDVVDLQFRYTFFKQQRAELRLNISDLLNQPSLTYKNQYGQGQMKYAERTPSVQDVPGISYQLAKGQADPKGTAYNKNYDVITGRRRYGTTWSLHFRYRL